MGKDIKGKELGVGIVQRKDGKYAARFIGRTKKGQRSILIKYQRQRNGWLRRNMKMNIVILEHLRK